MIELHKARLAVCVCVSCFFERLYLSSFSQVEKSDVPFSDCFLEFLEEIVLN